MSIELVATISLVLALVGLSIVVLIAKAVSARKAKKLEKLPLPVGQLPLSDEEKEEKKLVPVRVTEKIDGRPVYFFPVPGNRKVTIHGWLVRIKGRRAIIRLHGGKRVRRMAYLVYQLTGQPLRPVPFSKEHGEVTAYLVDIERKLESAAA